MESDKDFFSFLLHNSNVKQYTALIKSMTDSQYLLLKTWANDILDEIIPLNTSQFNELVQFKDIIRKLGRGKISHTALVKNINVVKTIAHIALNVNEVCYKTSASTNSRMGKGKETFTSQKYSKYCGSGSSSSDEGGSKDAEIWWKTSGSEEEERSYESNGSEEEECYLNN